MLDQSPARMSARRSSSISLYFNTKYWNNHFTDFGATTWSLLSQVWIPGLEVVDTDSGGKHLTA